MPSIVGNKSKGYTDYGGSNSYTPQAQSSYYQQYVEQQKALLAQQQAIEQSRYETLARENEAQRLMEEQQARQAAGQLGRQSAAGQLGQEGESWFSRMFTRGMGVDRLPQQTGLFMPPYGSPQWAQAMYGNRPVGSSVTPETPQQQEERLNILREKRRGYQVGMPGLDFVQNPQVLGSPSTNNNGGYGSGGGYPFPDFGGYGGYGGYGGGGYSYPKYSQSQDASKWYQTMVQWNIGNKQA